MSLVWILITTMLIGCTSGSDNSEPPTAGAVQVQTTGCLRTSISSGVAVSRDLVLTAAHNVVGNTAVDIIDGSNRVHAGIPVVVDTNIDIALVAVPGAGLESIPLADRVGDVTAVALPLRDPVLRSVSLRRVVWANTTDIYRERDVVKHALEIDAEIQSGDSGSPVMNTAGEIVGIVVSSTKDRDDSIAYAVHFDEIRALVDSAEGLDAAVETRCWR
ncbi:MAG: trypsin-like serine protease [Actinomycetia bacterium]|nr:trypsin-like serine protease [Actinomycetes bacterium]